MERKAGGQRQAPPCDAVPAPHSSLAPAGGRSTMDKIVLLQEAVSFFVSNVIVVQYSRYLTTSMTMVQCHFARGDNGMHASRSQGRSVRWATTAFLLGISVSSAASAQLAASDWQTLNRRAGETYRAGDFARATTLTEQALELARREFGRRHPNTLGSMTILAFMLDLQGRYGDAETLYQETLSLQREVLGPGHPDTLNTLNTMNGLARTLLRQGRVGEAEPLARQAVDLARRELGSQHTNTLSNINTLAIILFKQKRYTEAEPLLREALASTRHGTCQRL